MMQKTSKRQIHSVVSQPSYPFVPCVVAFKVHGNF